MIDGLDVIVGAEEELRAGFLDSVRNVGCNMGTGYFLKGDKSLHLSVIIQTDVSPIPDYVKESVKSLIPKSLDYAGKKFPVDIKFLEDDDIVLQQDLPQ